MQQKQLRNKTSIRPSIVAIFAHPDDEAFGPSGTLIKFAKTYDLYILCATKGEVGLGADKNKLPDIRTQELITSAKIIGAKDVFFLGFKDGTLSNSLYHKIAKKAEIILKKIKPEILMTFESKGISGHLDHIAISMVTTYLFVRRNIAKKLYYYCITEEKREKSMDEYFIYFPTGYKRYEVDEIVDVSAVWDRKVKAIRAHKSQKHDGERILKNYEKLAKEEHFFVLTK